MKRQVSFSEQSKRLCTNEGETSRIDDPFPENKLARVLPYIFPYLSFTELHNLCQLNRATSDLIRRTIKSGLVVTIDATELTCHPISSNEALYRKYGSITTNLKLRDIQEADLAKLLPFFKNIRQLALVNIVAIQKGWEQLPVGLSKLSLINCQIANEYLKEWFRCLTDLESLFIDRLVYHKSTYKFQELLKLSYIRHLKTLTIKGDSLYIDVRLSHLQSLVIIAKELHTSIFECRNLKNLVFDVANAPKWAEYQMYGKLKSLTIRSLIPEMIKNCGKLEFLRVYCNVDPEKRGFVSDITNQIQTVDVQFYDIPKHPNMILDKISDVILLKIADYLTVEDLLSFGSSHPRIDQLLAHSKNHTNAIKIDCKMLRTMASLFAAPPYTCQLQYVTKLHVTKVTDKDLLFGLQFFSRLKSLRLERINLSNETIAALPVSLESFSLLECSFGEAISNYFGRLTATLKELELRSLLHDSHCLLQLKNIRVFKFQPYSPYDVYLNFLRKNADSLERIEFLSSKDTESLDIVPYTDELVDFSDILQRMKKLTCLTIDLHYVRSYEMEDAATRAQDFNHLIPLFTELGPLLSELTLRVHGRGFKTLINGRLLTQLQSLRIISGSRVISEEDFQDLCTIKSIRKFTFEAVHYKEKEPMQQDHILQLIKSWPLLVEMHIEEFCMDLATTEKLETYLMENCRVLRINGSEYFK